MTTLVLFDIDATLLLSGGAGMQAMTEAGRRLFGSGFSAQGVDFAGRIDPLLVNELLARNGVQPTDDHARMFRSTYRTVLEVEMAASTRHHALPGAIDLVQALRAESGTVLGLLTGNFPETGAIKLRSCGFDPDWFAIRVWGDESPRHPPSRDDLPAVALSRWTQTVGHPVTPSRVTIVGDTPHDVQCAKAGGCRSLGVATGRFTSAQLLEAGADRAVADLRSTDELARWLRAI